MSDICYVVYIRESTSSPNQRGALYERLYEAIWHIKKANLQNENSPRYIILFEIESMYSEHAQVLLNTMDTIIKSGYTIIENKKYVFLASWSTDRLLRSTIMACGIITNGMPLCILEKGGSLLVPGGGIPNRISIENFRPFVDRIYEDYIPHYGHSAGISRQFLCSPHRSVIVDIFNRGTALKFDQTVGNYGMYVKRSKLGMKKNIESDEQNQQEFQIVDVVDSDEPQVLPSIATLDIRVGSLDTYNILTTADHVNLEAVYPYNSTLYGDDCVVEFNKIYEYLKAKYRFSECEISFKSSAVKFVGAAHVYRTQDDYNNGYYSGFFNLRCVSKARFILPIDTTPAENDLVSIFENLELSGGTVKKQKKNKLTSNEVEIDLLTISDKFVVDFINYTTKLTIYKGENLGKIGDVLDVDAVDFDIYAAYTYDSGAAYGKNASIINRQVSMDSSVMFGDTYDSSNFAPRIKSNAVGAEVGILTYEVVPSMYSYYANDLDTLCRQIMKIPMSEEEINVTDEPEPRRRTYRRAASTKQVKEKKAKSLAPKLPEMRAWYVGLFAILVYHSDVNMANIKNMFKTISSGSKFNMAAYLHSGIFNTIPKDMINFIYNEDGTIIPREEFRAKVLNITRYNGIDINYSI